MLFSSLRYLHKLRESNESCSPSSIISVTPSLIATTGVSSRGFPQAMSAMSVMSSAGKKGYHQGPVASVHILDRLPSFIVLPINILNFHLDYTRIDVIPTAINDSLLSKDLHTGLLRNVTKLMDGFVIGWKKVRKYWIIYYIFTLYYCCIHVYSMVFPLKWHKMLLFSTKF